MKKFVTYEEYRDLLKNLLERYKVYEEDENKLAAYINDFNVYNRQNIDSDTIKYTLRVERTMFPIKWEGKEGRIFEIIGSNSRNKTTTLIFTATLLGLNWDEIAPYIEDSKILKQAKLIQREISDGLPVYLNIENSKYRFEVDIRNSIASAVLWNKIKGSHQSFNDISLSTHVDWTEYQNKIGGFFDVQVVGVGRNFITQVGFEEASNLVMFCNEVCSFIAFYNQMLLSQKPKMNPVILRSQIEEINKKLKEHFAEDKKLKEDIELIKIKLNQTQNDYNRAKDIFSREPISKYFDLNKKKKIVQHYMENISSLKKQYNDYLQQIDNYTAIINNSSNQLALLDENIGLLKDKLDLISPILSLPKEIVESFESSLSMRDISNIIDFSNYFLIDNKTKEAHQAISNYSFQGISLSTKLLGLNYFNLNITNISDFKKMMSDAAKNSDALSNLRELFISLLEVINRINCNSTEKYQSEVSGLETLKGIVENLKTNLNDTKKTLEEENTKLTKEIAPFSTFDEIVIACNSAFSLIDENLLNILEQIAVIYNLETDINFVELLWEIIDSLNSQLQQFEYKLEDLDRYISTLKQRKKKLLDILRSIDENNQIDVRVNSLNQVKDFLSNVAEYFLYKRKHFESTVVNPDLERNFTNNMNNLGDDFEKILQMVNDRIRARCPFAFVNTDTGVEKRTVLEYDFLNSDFKVEGLEKVAQYHGGITSSMTVYGLATRKSGADFGSILLVDEWGDVGVYKSYVFEALSEIGHLAMAIFVDVDKEETETVFKRWVK